MVMGLIFHNLVYYLKLSENFEAMFLPMAGLEYSEILPTFRQVQQFVKIFSGNKSILTK